MNIKPKLYKFILFITPLFAFSNTQQSRDLWFLPGAQNFFATADLEYRATVTDFDAPGAPKPSDRSFNGGPSLIYGITDDFYVGAGFEFESKKDESLTSATTKESNTASGLNDPVFLAGYRLVKQSANDFYLDALLGFSPSIGKKKNKNVLRGSHVFGVGLKIGQEKEAVEYAFGVKLDYSTDQKFSDGNYYKSKFDFSFDADFQYDFNDLVALNAEFELGFLGDLKPNVSTVDTYKFDYVYTLSVGPSFQITENFVAGVGLEYGKVAGEWGVDFDSTTYALGANASYVF